MKEGGREGGIKEERDQTRREKKSRPKKQSDDLEVQTHVAVACCVGWIVGGVEAVLDPEEAHGGVGGDGAEAGGNLPDGLENEALSAEVHQARHVLRVCVRTIGFAQIVASLKMFDASSTRRRNGTTP